MKRLVSFILLISILLTGCSISSKQSETDSDGITEITFWHSMDGVFGDIVKEQIDEFNNTIGKEKGIKVTGVFQSWPGTTSLMTAMSAAVSLHISEPTRQAEISYAVFCLK